MNPVTEKKRQWLWFAALWCAGLAATAIVSYVFRWIVFNM